MEMEMGIMKLMLSQPHPPFEEPSRPVPFSLPQP